MRKIFGILCHRVTEPLLHTVSYLSKFEENIILIHVDKKTDISLFGAIKSSNVILLEDRVKVYWGHISQIDATLKLLCQANKFEYDYFFLLSGDDIPLKTNDEINQILNQFDDYDFIDCNDDTNIIPEDRVRFNYPNFFYTKEKKLLIKIKKLFVYNTRKIFFRNKKFDNCLYPIPKMYKGAQWFTFKKSTVEFILNYIATNAWFYELFEHSICADEVFFHTVFKINQELKIFRNSRYLNSELRYIDWKSGPEYPKMLNVSDMVAMKSSNCLFARKLPPDADKGFMNSFLLESNL